MNSNKMTLIIAFFTIPFLSMSQNDVNTSQLVISTEIKKEIMLDETEVSLRKVEPISNNPKIQNKTINFNKSNDLISIKAYLKSLQMKRKETLMS